MSFLGSIVDSIGGGRAPPPPPKAPNGANAAGSINTDVKAAPQPGGYPAAAPLTGTKRKAEDITSTINARANKIKTPNPTTTKRSAAPPLNAPKPQQDKSAKVQSSQGIANATSKAPPTSTANIANAAPPRGSYAEMMARAKQIAEQRAQSQVGTIKHQETKKEKMSRLTERRKEGQDKSKTSKLDSSVKSHARKEIRRSTSPPKKDIKQPAKSATAPPKPSYKGTMGMATSRSGAQPNGRPGAKKTRYDEYLATDEEDNSDVLDEDEDDYGSDASSAMEAGFDDVEMEETTALKAARDDDAQEMALEAQLKREKEERRKKLLGLVKKQR